LKRTLSIGHSDNGNVRAQQSADFFPTIIGHEYCEGTPVRGCLRELVSIEPRPFDRDKNVSGLHRARVDRNTGNGDVAGPHSQLPPCSFHHLTYSEE
jgi:hypothetical protein